MIAPKTSTIADLKKLIIKREKLSNLQSLYIFAGKHNCTEFQIIEQLYEKYKNHDDLFLHITYSDIDSFG